VTESHSVSLGRDHIVNEKLLELASDAQGYRIGSFWGPLLLLHEPGDSVRMLTHTSDGTEQIAVTDASLVNVSVVDSILEHLNIWVNIAQSLPFNVLEVLELSSVVVIRAPSESLQRLLVICSESLVVELSLNRNMEIMPFTASNWFIVSTESSSLVFLFIGEVEAIGRGWVRNRRLHNSIVFFTSHWSNFWLCVVRNFYLQVVSSVADFLVGCVQSSVHVIVQV
jgi:hypothetical protein